MRAYIVMNDESLDTIKVLDLMKEFLSFDTSEQLKKNVKRNGEIFLFQDLPLVCEYCKIKDDTVVYHHYYGRRYKHLKHDIDNRIPLCNEHHNGSSNFSAHLTPKKFETWILEKRGREWLYRLNDKKHVK